jgi:hypothetical protein
MPVLVNANTKVFWQGLTDSRCGSGFNVIPADDLDDAAQKIVMSVREEA